MDFIFLIAGIFIGFAIGWLFFRNKSTEMVINPEEFSRLEKEKIQLEERLRNLDQEKQNRISDLVAEITRYRTELDKERLENTESKARIAASIEKFTNQETRLNQQKLEIEELQKRFQVEFENIANKILDEKSKKFTEQNKQNIDGILTPLRERIRDFEDKVDKTYRAELEEKNSLKLEIKKLVELNKQVSEDANNLAVALKGDNKTQGNWGEMLLENILERSGLERGREYEVQVSVNTDEGKRVQPDVIIYLPENKHVIIDSKVSLVAYQAAVTSATEEARAGFLKQHVDSVKAHVKGLSEKNYQGLPAVNTPDFVLMFMPIESSFSVAIQADNELFNYAWDRKIVIVGPSTLLATLRTIASVWKQEKQTKNAIEIAEQSGRLYDKFVGFLDDMLRIGDRINGTQKAYDDAMNKLKTGSGNLIGRIEHIKKLGAKTKGQIDTKLLEDITPQNENS